MKHIDRLHAILILLQSKRVVKAQEIAERFGISLRTVYRDMRSLDESGIPIGAEAGVGYFLTDSYSLPPVSFTQEEASSLLFAEKFVESMSDRNISRDFLSAITKIKAVLLPFEKDRLETLNHSIAVLNRNHTFDVQDEQLHLSELQQAITHKQVVEIEYNANYNNTRTSRRIEPIGLCNYSARWHLFAWCNLRHEYRDFRLDRISRLRILDEDFKDKTHLSLNECMKNIVDREATHANIAIVVNSDIKRFIDDTKHWYGFIAEEPLDDTRTRLLFANTELNGFAAWLLNSGCFATIEYPQSLIETIRRFIQEATEHYY